MNPVASVARDGRANSMTHDDLRVTISVAVNDRGAVATEVRLQGWPTTESSS